MLKRYKIGKYTFQYEEGTQPEGAVEVVKQEPVKAVEEKSAETVNKSRATTNKRRTVKAK